MTDAIDENKALANQMEAERNAELLKKFQAACEETSINQVAKRIGQSRTTVSLIYNDKYPANPKNILAAFDRAYSQIQCPHLQQAISPAQCHEFYTRQRPSNPLGVQHWRACQSCTCTGGK